MPTRDQVYQNHRASRTNKTLNKRSIEGGNSKPTTITTRVIKERPKRVKQYVLGFLFDPTYENVALIKKLRPEWQKDKFNGIGGKVEPGESYHDAMVREFFEETSLIVEYWNHRLTLKFDEAVVEVFSQTSNAFSELRTTTDELVHICPVVNLYKLNTIPNIKWLVPMLLDPQIKEPQTIFGYENAHQKPR